MTEQDKSDTMTIDFSANSLQSALMEVERTYLGWAMTRANGNKAEAARITGMTYDALKKKLARYRQRVAVVLE